MFLKEGRLIEEDISLFEEIHYRITVKQVEQAMVLLQKNQIQAIVESHQLKISITDGSLQNVLNLLHTEGVIVLDVEKQVTGSEDRYREIFGKQVEADEAPQV